ncbi:MAG: hypothetical protein ABIL01_11215 [Pseudomonadota bacterium]
MIDPLTSIDYRADTDIIASNTHFRLQLARLLVDYDNALHQPSRSHALTIASFSILSLCATYAAAWPEPELNECVRKDARTYEQGCYAKFPANNAVTQLMHVLVPILINANVQLKLHGRLSQICLSLWQIALTYIQRNPELHPSQLVDNVWDLALALERGRAADCGRQISAIAAKVVACESTRSSRSWYAQRRLPPKFDVIAKLYGQDAVEPITYDH